MTEPLNKLKVFCWTLFDFANTAFSVMIVTFSYPLFYKIVISNNSEYSDLYWGITVSISMLITAIMAPIFGAAADYSHNSKKMLLLLTAISIAATALLSQLHTGMLLLGSVFFIFANIGFEGGIVFYDSFLPKITIRKNFGRVSGYGFAMGYLGALVILAINFPLLKNGISIENINNIHLSLLITALFFFIFAIPLFLVITEEKSNKKFSLYPYFKIGLRRVKATISDLQKYKNIGNFLLSFFVYNDGIMTVISFASIIAVKSFDFSASELIYFFLFVQTFAIAGSIIFGVISDKIGSKKTIIISLILWIILIIFAYFSTTKTEFYFIGSIVGVLLGASQSSSRSLMAKLTPKEQEAEFFGFYDGLCGKASAILGPLLFGLVSSIGNNQKFAIVTIGLFFAVGLILIMRVKEN
jgi:UMF1 family MFS transporter